MDERINNKSVGYFERICRTLVALERRYNFKVVRVKTVIINILMVNSGTNFDNNLSKFYAITPQF